MAPSQVPELVRDGPTGQLPQPLTGDEVVITGMSGIFPSSDSTMQFMENLYNKVDMVSSDINRWKFDHPEVPTHLGLVNGMGKFDAQFFRVHYKQACAMEPMSRKLLEHAYSAIYDSGINPLQLRGKKVGVFIGSSFSESEKIVIYESVQRNGFGITGCNKAMYANRISYWIDGKGPSYALDLACASSLACVEHAYKAISSGQCDAAIVGGCNLCMHPNVSLNMKRAGFLCMDGKTKCFDKNGDGYVRSDAMSVIFMQKAKDAKRIYSEVYKALSVYSVNPCPDFHPVRESKDIEDFFNEFYSNINVSPNEVEYIEANGAAMAKADGEELEAIGKVFAKDKPIKVGCVKSNMGHSEPASGVCSITKVCLAYHKGQLPANLHYYEPQDHIPSVRDGKVQILQEHASFNRGFAALNSFSYSGANVHILLKGHYKPKDPERYRSNIPRLIVISGRQESCVKTILHELEEKPIDPEQIGLLLSIHESEIPGHMCRGYTILDTNEEKEIVCLSKKLDYISGVTRPVWFVYSGMGSQWAGMGADLMRIPIFAGAIQKCHEVLSPKGIDIIRILTQPDNKIYDNILHSFVGIAAVQIGLTDILKELNIVPNKIIGHSVGELGCAYADGCFTAEQMILSAYSRGLVSLQTPFIRGSMAAVGMGYKSMLKLCPPEIEVACHNSSKSCTISGPADIMKEFVTKLTKEGIFAKEVPCSNIAYHSRYIADAGPGLRKYLSEVITDPKLRSEKWVSTSVPQDKWNEALAKYSSAEYHTNNLLNAVLFEEASVLIPENALVIEIAPHGLLQAILKRSHSGCTHVPLTKKGHSKPVQFLLEAVGKLYQEGLHPKVDRLYPKIEYPVSTETPFLSHLVEWVHSEEWTQAKYISKDVVVTKCRDFVISIHDDDYKYLEGYMRDGKLVFPEAAQLVLVWETISMYNGLNYNDVPIVFHNVHFHNEAYIETEKPFKLVIMIHKGDNKFEVSHNNIPIMTGEVRIAESANHFTINEITDNDDIILTATDIYKIMHLKGHSFREKFQSIHAINNKCNKADIKWCGDWITLLDSLIQFNMLERNHAGISIPKLIKKLTINTDQHKKEIKLLNDKSYLRGEINSVFERTRCAGVEIFNLIFDDKPTIMKESDVLVAGSFVPHFLRGNVDIKTALLAFLQIIADDLTKDDIYITEILTDKASITNYMEQVIKNIMTTNFNLNIVHVKNFELENLQILNKSDVYIIDDLLGHQQKMKNLYCFIPTNSFIIAIEEKSTPVQLTYKLFNVVATMYLQEKQIVLLKRKQNKSGNTVYVPISHDAKFLWVPRVQYLLQKSESVVLLSHNSSYCGLIGAVKKLHKQHSNKIRLVVVEDQNAPSFDPDNNFYKMQLQKNLTINIFKKGVWGGYYYLPEATFGKVQNIKLITEAPGSIDSLTWTEYKPKPASNNSIQVYYTGPSFRDAERAVSNKKTDTNVFGMDFSGLNSKGERIMGLISGGAIADTVEADPDLIWPVPEHWTLEEAATVPLTYMHAYYCLVSRFALIKNKSVFVTGGAGAFGQAIISICLALNCSVYTVVSDIRKKRFLQKLFPELKGSNIGCSRDDAYHNMVRNNTNGLRCNYVINCLNGIFREAAMKCTGLGGIFIDVSDVDILNNREIGMSYLQEERNYCAVNLSNLFKSENTDYRKALQFMVTEGIANGTVRPITRVLYSPKDVTKAFRLLSSSKQRGRVLLRMRDPVSFDQGLHVQPRVSYSSTGSYVVVCDEELLGIEIADHLVKNGVKNLVLHLNSTLINGYVNKKWISWQEQGVAIKVSYENLHSENGCIGLLQNAAALNVIQGIFVIQNSGVTSYEFKQEDFIQRYNETTRIVVNLDIVSRKKCADLRYFVVLTRPSNCIADNYMASATEKICHARNNDGLHALVFQISRLDDFDHAPNVEATQRRTRPKVRPQTLSTMFISLDKSLRIGHNNVLAFNVKKESSCDVFQKVTNILGLNKIDDLEENLTMADLSLSDLNVNELKSFLKEELDISYPSEDIKKLTIMSLKQLSGVQGAGSGSCTNKGGLGTFYTFIEKDECLATEPMIAMPTKLNIENELQINPTARYLFLVPGFEGHHQIFIPICERLKLPAMTLQLGPDLTNFSIQETALNIMKFLKQRFQLKSKFYLLGYSFGVNIVLELAALMEKEGYLGVIYCLDSSPEVLKVQLDAHLGILTDTELQNAIVEYVYHLVTGKECNQLKDDLKKMETWSDKVEACVDRSRGLVNYSHEYKRSILETAYRRIKLVRDYEPKFKLESEVVLMKGFPHSKAEKMADDYDLSKYTKLPVKVFQLESEHAQTPYDCRVSNIINRLLEPELLEKFRKTTLCETYLCEPMKIFDA